MELTGIRNDEHLAEVLALAVEWEVNGLNPAQVVRNLVDDYTIPLETARIVQRTAHQFLREQADIRE